MRLKQTIDLRARFPSLEFEASNAESSNFPIPTSVAFSLAVNVDSWDGIFLECAWSRFGNMSPGGKVGWGCVCAHIGFSCMSVWKPINHHHITPHIKLVAPITNHRELLLV